MSDQDYENTIARLDERIAELKEANSRTIDKLHTVTAKLITAEARIAELEAELAAVNALWDDKFPKLEAAVDILVTMNAELKKRLGGK